jgi:hypothetical protein
MTNLYGLTCEHLRDEKDECAQPVEHVVHVGARKRAPATYHTQQGVCGGIRITHITFNVLLNPAHACGPVEILGDRAPTTT